ncbi:hypothetical protein SODALDRAFT_399929 [Sodiomyces alkalinus F11]|uniref:AB hydrolase-1 domain-containing protein n=1 Tax=Sodiomyces alkalinus (strain CBS 110278 / VKM F-3762 / F11) TaxID=1314773 RepID=A0A3N2PTK8_SODAK|nr:hypothetical protein SODALDRAFT_399929 [Sodiomyces alkalinus F11]ROT37774.1 hypothetical protein SODALDRAFT_399929 [Sodiomyces alkalinus F11]
MIVGPSYAEYLLAGTAMILFTYLGPLCVAYFLLLLSIAGIPGISHPISIAIEVLGALEILFYFVWFLPYRAYLQRRRPLSGPLARDMRRRLFYRQLGHVADMETYLSKWHHGAQFSDIRRDNLQSWLLWALFERDGDPGEDAAEVDEYIEAIERKCGFRFQTGSGVAVPLRLAFDPVQMRHRSLLFYMMVGFLDTVTATILRLRGFKFYRQPRGRFFTVFPPRLQTVLATSASASPQLSYYYRPPAPSPSSTSPSHRPVLFLHGVGIGLAAYLPWLLFFAPPEAAILIPEFLPVSSRICAPLPPTLDLIRSLSAILTQQDLRDAVLVAHSFGTFLLSPLLSDPDMANRVSAIVPVDPVCLLLHLPETAYNFTRSRPPSGERGAEWQLRFVGTDPGISYTFSRRLRWHEHILWGEQLLDRARGWRATVVVGGRDSIIDPAAVANERSDESDAGWLASKERWTGREELELIYLAHLDHGHTILGHDGMRVLGEVVKTYTSVESLDSVESASTAGTPQ